MLNSFINGKYVRVPSAICQMFYDFLIFYELLRQDKYEDKNKYETLVKYLLTLHKTTMQ